MRHNLPQVSVIGFDANMTDAAGKYAGMDRMQCREGGGGFETDGFPGKGGTLPPRGRPMLPLRHDY